MPISVCLSFGIYYDVRHFGEKEGYRRLKKDLLCKLEKGGSATVPMHLECFVRSIGEHGLMKIPLTFIPAFFTRQMNEWSRFDNGTEYPKLMLLLLVPILFSSFENLMVNI